MLLLSPPRGGLAQHVSIQASGGVLSAGPGASEHENPICHGADEGTETSRG